MRKKSTLILNMSLSLYLPISFQAFQFSAVSQDKLSVAVQLAKRDIKQKKLDESLKMQEKEKKSRKQNLGIQSRYTRDTQKKNTKNVVSTKEKVFHSFLVSCNVLSNYKYTDSM